MDAAASLGEVQVADRLHDFADAPSHLLRPQHLQSSLRSNRSSSHCNRLRNNYCSIRFGQNNGKNYNGDAGNNMHDTSNLGGDCG